MTLIDQKGKKEEPKKAKSKSKQNLTNKIILITVLTNVSWIDKRVICTALALSLDKFIRLRTLLVIKQKSKYQDGCFKKTKHAKFSEKQTFLTPWYADKFRVLCFLETPVLVCVSEVRNVRFSENLAWFVFLKHPSWDFPFCLITDDFRMISHN